MYMLYCPRLKEAMLGRRTNKQKIQEQVDRALKVKDLKEILDKLPDNMLIGCVGHFGEAYLISSYDIREGKAYLTPDGFWRDPNQLEIELLVFEMPDIGPDPD